MPPNSGVCGNFSELMALAWSQVEHAYSKGARVGAAAITRGGLIYCGCNVQHEIRSHDIHAEVNALGCMVAAGHHDLAAIAVASTHNNLAPCGACLDWILQFGGPECVVLWQSDRTCEPETHRAVELLPYHFDY